MKKRKAADLHGWLLGLGHKLSGLESVCQADGGTQTGMDRTGGCRKYGRSDGSSEAPPRRGYLLLLMYRYGCGGGIDRQGVEARMPAADYCPVEAVFGVDLCLYGDFHKHGVMLYRGEPGADSIMDVGIAINGPLNDHCVYNGTSYRITDYR